MRLQLRASAEPVPGYRLVERLGAGGYGEVWKAEAPGGVLVALKFVPLAGSDQDNPELRALELIRNVRHPHLLDIQFASLTEDWLIIGTSLCEQSLADRLKECQTAGQAGIPGDELLGYMAETAKAIDYLNEPRHQVADGPAIGIQHRDLKPKNIFLVGGSVQVGDFGLAKFLDRTSASHTFGRYTPAFAAPEMFRGQVSARSDQYSLAVTYYQLRTGRIPFRGDNAVEILKNRVNAEPDLSDLPEAERPVVARALATDPEKRWPSCREFVRQLETAATGVAGVCSAVESAASPTVSEETDQENQTQSSGRRSRWSVDGIEEPAGRRPWFWGLAVVLAGLCVVALSVPRWRDRRKPPTPTEPTPVTTEQASTPATDLSAPAVPPVRRPATLIVATQPGDAQVVVDDPAAKVRVLGGKTEITLEPVDGTSPLIVTVARDGYRPSRREWTCQPGGRTELDVSLEPLPAVISVAVVPEHASVRTRSGQVAALISVGKQQLTLADIDGQRSYSVVATADGYEDLERTVTPRPGETLALSFHLQPKPATLLVRVTPPRATLAVTSGQATVVRRGQDYEVTIDRPDGRHAITLTASLPDYEPAEREITLQPGETGRSLDLQLQQRLQRFLTNSIGMQLAYIPPGVFLMGSSNIKQLQQEAARMRQPPDYFTNEYPQHQVRISKPFYLGRHEVTVDQFRNFVSSTGYETEAERRSESAANFLGDTFMPSDRRGLSWWNPGFVQTGTHPVTFVTWQDADTFCRWLSDLEGQPYRLPTEAEWEYACRGTTTTAFWTGDDPQELVTAGNVPDASYRRERGAKEPNLQAATGDDRWVYTSPVGSYRPNLLGLYDTHGNVWEWCRDWYDPKYYARLASRETSDPTGPDQGRLRVLRGGCFQ